MPARTPEERALVGRIAAAERWATTPDRVAATKPARDGRRAKIAAEIIAHTGELPPEERERRIDDKIRAQMLRMSLASKQARRRAKEQVTIAEAAEAELSLLGAPTVERSA